ncbi:MAG: IPTL-CTERM sorting domain-containing protein [Xanthomonadales bacterium]|nr:IPTL-CTERM sorting domain-containing protein [Xanthomonadales bacterium]
MNFMYGSIVILRGVGYSVCRTNSNQRRLSGLPLALGCTALLLGSVPALAATAPDLGSTSPYAIVSSTFTNTTAGTSITGDVCYTTPPAVAPAVTGAIAVPCPAQTGTDQNAARNDLISQVCTPIGAAVALNAISIGGGPPGEFPPGCYSSTGAMSITTSTTVTLTGTGVHIFRPGGALDPGANSNIVMAGGACEDNVFWAPSGATTIGANSNFIGTIFRGTAEGLSITFGDTSTLVGRALAYGSTVTTANTTITVPAPCLVPATITVNKNFIPNSISTVPVALSCTSGTVTTTPLNASESNPAVFTVTGANPGATCTATETVPVGYTANQVNCAGVALGGSCTITNTLNSNTIVVSKDFIPNSIATVPVALSCTSGTVTTTPLNASESNPAVFTVTGASQGATCTATESVPAGYTGNQATCVGVALGGSCTITNTLNSNTITVNKNFIPNSIATVPVALSCTSGMVTATPLNASESLPAVFTVTGASPGATCTATETVPNGYTGNQANCAGVALGGSCTITNTVNSDTIVVNKDFNPNSNATVAVALSCTSGTVTNSPLDASESTPAVFAVTGANAGATCTATETVPVGYTANQSGCVGVALGSSCTITNSLDSNTITVNKDFSPNSIATVPVALSCTSGTVTATPLNASESTPAVFTVTGASQGATCTATETVPVGYTGNQANCAGVALGGSCTITNTLSSNTIVVNKDFSPNSTATVPVALSCTSGTVTTTPKNASESTPAVFTVTGANPGATCTATETVPNGYTANQSDCVGVALGGSCTIINTQEDLPERATFRVIKDFTDGNPMQVEVTLSCNTGLILDQNKNISESQDVEFVVTSFDQGELNCDVTEELLTGYTPDYTASAPTGVGLFSSDLQGCHFDEVVSGQFVCVITNSPDLVDIEIEKLWVIDSDNEDGVNKNYKLSLYCDDPIGLVNVFHGDDSGTFISEVQPQYPSTHCWVIEAVYSSAVEIDNQCQNLEISAALGGDSCLITNTVFFESIPTLDRYGLIMLMLLVLGVGVVGFRRFN